MLLRVIYPYSLVGSETYGVVRAPDSTHDSWRLNKNFVSVAPNPWGQARVPPLLQMSGHGGHREYKNSKQETDQTALTISKALTKTTNCTFRAKKWRGTTKKKKNFGALRRICAPTFSPDRCPHL